MKSLIFVFSILAAFPTVAAEVWWLEMDKTFHDALIKRFTEGDFVACRQIGDKLPELIKQGKIKELEWVSSESKTGGRHFPAGEIEKKFPNGRIGRLKTGSMLQVTTKSDLFKFVITTPGGDATAELSVLSSAPFAKQWQPIFSTESGGRTRILLGRDLASTEDFWKIKGLFSASAPMPEPTKFTWMLCETHPILIAAAEQQTKSEYCMVFRETRSLFLFNKPSGDVRDFGTTFETRTDPKHGRSISIETLLEKKDSIGEVFRAVKYGMLEPSGDAIKFPVNTHIEKINPDGFTENLNKKISGEAVVTLKIPP